MVRMSDKNCNDERYSILMRCICAIKTKRMSSYVKDIVITDFRNPTHILSVVFLHKILSILGFSTHPPPNTPIYNNVLPIVTAQVLTLVTVVNIAAPILESLS